MKQRTVVTGVVVVAVLAVGGLLLRGGPETAAEWRTATVERGDLVVAVSATGAVQPVTQVQVGTQVTGTILALYADFNSRVTQGQVVAQLDPAPFKGRVDSDRANLARSQADVVRVQALLNQAERELERYQRLVDSELVTESEYEGTLANRDSLKAQVQVAEASVRQQEATLAISEVNLRYTTIESPIDGIVVSRNVDVGQTVSASLSAPTIFVIAADLERMQVQAAVAEADIGRVQVGQPVGFHVDAFTGEEFHGNVSQVRLAPTTVQNVVTYTVLVDAANPGGRLMPGMTADLTFEIERRPDVLLVPDSALRFSPVAEGPGAGASAGRGEGGERGRWSGGGMGGAPGGGMAGAGGGSNGGTADGHGTGEGVATAATDGNGRDDRGSTHRVYVLGDDGPRPVEVSTGPSDGVHTAVLAGPLSEGDVVVTGRATPTTGAPTNPFVPSRPPGMSRGPR